MRVRKAPEIRLGAIFSVHKAVNQIMVAVARELTGLDIARDERQRQTFWEATVGQLQPALVGTNKPRSRKQIRRLLSPIVVVRIDPDTDSSNENTLCYSLSAGSLRGHCLPWPKRRADAS